MKSLPEVGTTGLFGHMEELLKGDSDYDSYKKPLIEAISSGDKKLESMLGEEIVFTSVDNNAQYGSLIQGLSLICTTPRRQSLLVDTSEHQHIEQSLNNLNKIIRVNQINRSRAMKKIEFTYEDGKIMKNILD